MEPEYAAKSISVGSAQAQPEVGRELDRMNDAVNRLEATVEMITIRLQPILNGDQNDPGPDVAEVEAPRRTDIGRSIADMRSRVDRAQEHLNRHNNALEV